MELYDRLISITEAFIDTFDGAMRIRGIQTLLLVQKATRFGHGISPSEVRRRTGTPLESIRRRFFRFEESGLLDSRVDPKDDRSRLFRTTAAGNRAWPVEVLAARLHAIGPPDGHRESDPRPLEPDTFDAMIDVLQAFADAFDGGMRIRGFKTALLIQQATRSGRGTTASALSRSTHAALETVRRHMAKHTALGDLTMVEDPDDDRANRVYTADPAREDDRFQTVARRLHAIDWKRFHLTD